MVKFLWSVWSWILSLLFDKILAGFFERLFRVALLKRFFGFFARFKNEFRVVLGIFFCLMIYAFYKLYCFSELEVRNVENILRYKKDPTEQKYKGIEAFFFQDLDSLDESVSEIQNLEISANAREELENLVKSLNINFATEEFSRKNCKELFKFNTVKNRSEFITDEGQKDFLYIPVHAFRESFSSNEKNILHKGEDKKEIDRIVKDKLFKDQPLKRDIKFLVKSSNFLKRITKVDFFQKSSDFIDSKPIQVFVSTKEGVFRIFRSYGDQKKEGYSDRFPANTNLLSRPYFWETFSTATYCCSIDLGEIFQTSFVKNNFLVTGPYMDMGGNGMIVTLTRAFNFQGSEILVGLDFPVSGLKVYKHLQNVSERNYFSYGQVTVDPEKLDPDNIKVDYENPSSLVVSGFWKLVFNWFGPTGLVMNPNTWRNIKDRILKDGLPKILRGINIVDKEKSVFVTIPIFIPDGRDSTSYRLFYAYISPGVYDFVFKVYNWIFGIFCFLIIFQVFIFFYNKEERLSKIKNSSKKLKDFLFFTHSPIFEIDENGNFVYANYYFLRLYKTLGSFADENIAWNQISKKNIHDDEFVSHDDSKLIRKMCGDGIAYFDQPLSVKMKIGSSEKEVTIFYPYVNLDVGPHRKIIIGFVVDQETKEEKLHEKMQNLYVRIKGEFASSLSQY